MTFVVIWRYIKKTELNWINLKAGKTHLSVCPSKEPKTWNDPQKLQSIAAYPGLSEKENRDALVSKIQIKASKPFSKTKILFKKKKGTTAWLTAADEKGQRPAI